MSFQGADPYGTSGGTENIAKPITPQDNRIARGKSFILILRVNGPVSHRLRENVEDVVRILGLAGQGLVGIITRSSGVVKDSNTSDMDFLGPFLVSQIAPGVVQVDLNDNFIDTAMLQDAVITAIKMANDSVATAAIQDLAVTTPKIAIGAVDTAALGNLQVTTGKIAANAVDSSKIADNAVGNSELADNAVNTAEIVDGAVTAAKIASSVSLTPKVYNNLSTQIITGDITPADYTAKYTIPANTLQVGDIIRIYGFGESNNSTGATRNSTLLLRLAGVTILSLPNVAISSGASNIEFVAQADMVVASIGAGGTVTANGFIIQNGGADASDITGTVAINTTIANTIGWGMVWSLLNAGLNTTLRGTNVLKL